MEPVIGIDLGTTYSAVATVEGGKPKLILSRAGTPLTPSVIGFTESGERVAGERAQQLGDEAPDRVAFATKRFIGQRWTQELANAAKAWVPYPLVAGPNGEVRIKVAGRALPLTQIGAMLLGELKLDAEAHFGCAVHKAVITVPANFDDNQRSATMEAARIAGLEVLRMINEPTAAAIAYALGAKFEGRVLVFDLGGGTFDVSILEVQNGVYEVKASGGDAQLGGEDFDLRILQWLLAQVPDAQREVVRQDRVSMQRLRYAAERAKRALTEKNEAYISLSDLGDHSEPGRPMSTIDTALTRDFFELLSKPLSEKCLAVCERTLREANTDPRQIQAVLLVGGMTRVPLIRKLVTDFFGRAPVGTLNPDEVVALGAAVHAAELGQHQKQALLIDVATHSLSVGVLGGTVRRLIARNTPVPATAKDTFLPSHAGQELARIPIFQGESEYASDCAKLGELVLSDLKVDRRGDVPIEVTFELSAEGTLSARAEDTSTGVAEAIRIDARMTLSAPEVDKLQAEQKQYADVQAGKDKDLAMKSFPRILDKAERLAQVLEKSAQENPGPDADAVVGEVRALLARGRAAHKAVDMAAMADVTRTLEQLLSVA